MTWKLKRVKQCAKCPWRIDVDPRDIPNGYCETKHAALSRAIAEPGSLRGSDVAMSCHEHPEGDEAHCVGWLVNQLGRGNNIGLRMQMLDCENARHIQVFGDQHERFEDTLPEAQY